MQTTSRTTTSIQPNRSFPKPFLAVQIALHSNLRKRCTKFNFSASTMAWQTKSPNGNRRQADYANLYDFAISRAAAAIQVKRIARVATCMPNDRLGRRPNLMWYYFGRDLWECAISATYRPCAGRAMTERLPRSRFHQDILGHTRW